MRRAGTSSVVMIGDQLETDIKGARAAGLDAVWIETGVTADDPRGDAGASAADVAHGRPGAGRAGERAMTRPRTRAADRSGGRRRIRRGGPSARAIEGRDVVLVPIDVAAHGPTLYALSHGPEREAQWMYLWDGPYPSEAAFLENLAQKAVSDGSVLLQHRRARVGRRRRRRLVPAHHAEGSRDRGRQHPVHAGAAADARRDRGDVPDGPPRLRDARLSALRVEVQRAQRAVAAGGACASASSSRASSAST